MNKHKNRLKKTLFKEDKFLKRRYFLFVVFLFITVILILDSVIDYLIYDENDLMYFFFPPLNSHDFFNKIMIFVTFSFFGGVLYYLLKKRLVDQESLVKSELRFRTIANFTKDWEYWISPRKEIIYMSPSCERITGFSNKEFYKNPGLLNNIILEEDKKLFIGHETCALSENELDPIEFRIVTKDKRIVWIDHSCQSVYDESGNYVGHRVSNRDITSRKEVEDKLRETTKQLEEKNILLKREVDFSYLELEAIISQSPYAKAIYDKQGKAIKVNKAWKKLFQKKIPMDSVYDISRYNEKLTKKIEKVLRNGTAFKSEPLYIEPLDKMLQVSIYAIRNLNNEIEKVVCNYEDITDQMLRSDYDRELEMQKIISKKMFDFLETERKHISKELHDQIGQKLMLIKLNAEMLKENAPEEKEKIDAIINLLLSTNKEIKEIIYSLHPAELENYGLVAALDSMVQTCSSIGKYEASIHVYGTYETMGRDTELAIYRICQEIASNITKHSKATEASFEFHFEKNEFIGIITDNGTGFNINEYQIEGNAPRSFGLISVKERAKILDGFLEVHSKLNEGTTVYFQIPLKEKADAKN
ncbi:MAG: PAS domain S-box protein [Chlorobi bacterium]|nr:PAS domain S-box protein [Chlorobiota bacterium]